MLQTAPFVKRLQLTTSLKSTEADQKTFSRLWKSIDLFVLTDNCCLGSTKLLLACLQLPRQLINVLRSMELCAALKPSTFVPFQRLCDVPFIAFTPSTKTLVRHGSLLQVHSFKYSTWVQFLSLKSLLPFSAALNTLQYFQEKNNSAYSAHFWFKKK